MIECVVFDKNLNQKDIIPFGSAKITPHIFDYQPFEIQTPAVLTAGGFLTFMENREPLFSGYITEAEKSGNDYTYKGYDLKYVLDGIQDFTIYDPVLGITPVQGNVYNTQGGYVIERAVLSAFPGVTLEYADMSTFKFYTSYVRIKSQYEVCRDVCFDGNKWYEFFITGNGKIRLKIKDIRDLSASIVLLTDITHTEVSTVSSIKEKYNQILGLGSGEDSERDYYFRDDSNGERPKCYVYDLRENITHTELVRRTNVKFSELKFQYEKTFKILDNNVSQFGRDYGLGDYVTFKSETGETFSDLITMNRIEIKNGVVSGNLEIVTGLIKNTLTDKIKELKEGGTK